MPNPHSPPPTLQEYRAAHPVKPDPPKKPVPELPPLPPIEGLNIDLLMKMANVIARPVADHFAEETYRAVLGKLGYDAPLVEEKAHQAEMARRQEVADLVRNIVLSVVPLTR